MNQSQLIALTTNLLYPSESDEPIIPVSFGVAKNWPSTGNALKKVLGVKKGQSFKTVSNDSFWNKLFIEQDWHSQSDRENIVRYKTLKEFLELNLKDIKCCHIGKIEKTVYLIGYNHKGLIEGIKTQIIQS